MLRWAACMPGYPDTTRRLITWPALQVGKPAEEDLKSWGHHSSPSTVPDDIMAQADPSVVSFVFSCQVRKPVW